MKRSVVLVLVASVMAGCALGGSYTAEGPHPHMSFAFGGQVGPVQVHHAALSNSKPVSDLTAGVVRLGPTFGHWQPTVGLGWQLSRNWGACDAQGYNCAKHWFNGPAASIGATYRARPFRADASLFVYERAAIDNAIVVLFGFDL